MYSQAKKSTETHIPTVGVVDDRNTVEGQLIGAKTSRPSPHFAVQIKKYVGDLHYPATREELYNHAKVNGAPVAVLEKLDYLPQNVYQSAQDVHDALAEPT